MKHTNGSQLDEIRTHLFDMSRKEVEDDIKTLGRLGNEPPTPRIHGPPYEIIYNSFLSLKEVKCRNCKSILLYSIALDIMEKYAIDFGLYILKLTIIVGILFHFYNEGKVKLVERHLRLLENEIHTVIESKITTEKTLSIFTHISQDNTMNDVLPVDLLIH